MMKRTSGVLAALLASTLFLSGCAGTGTGSGTDVFSGDAKAQPTTADEPAPTVIPGDENGDGKLSEREKELLAKKVPRDYTLPDGSVVTIDPAVPLPSAVVDAVRTTVSPKVDAAFSTSQGPELYEFNKAVQAELETHAAATGRGIIAAYQVRNREGITWFAMRSGGMTLNVDSNPDKNVFIANLEKWAGGRYEIIVFD